MKRPAFWIALALLAALAMPVAIRFFPKAFSIVALDITMDRDRALADARAIMSRDGFGPAAYRQAASFALDGQAQTFVELEGGGKETFTSMMRDGLYAAYTWRVRHFKEGEVHETTIRFTPDGQPYGFVERLREDAPGAALDGVAARQLAEAGAARWSVDLGGFVLVEQGQERRGGGRVDHTLTYERLSPALNEGRYRLRLVVSGDRLTEVSHFIRIPEAFTRRYANLRSANDAIGLSSVVGMALLYIFGGIGVGLFYLLRTRWVIWRPAVMWGAAVGLLQALAMWNELPLLWMTYDTAIARSTFLAEHAAQATASFFGFSVFFALSFMAAESLTRRAFGHHPQLWRAWSGQPPAPSSGAPGASTAILGRTVAGYLLVPVFLAYVVMFYFVAVRDLGWWSPSEALLHPDVLATYVPWLSAIANSFQAGFWEEALFRAVPLAGAALIGDRFGQRRLFLILGFAIQALIFGAGHAQYPGQPAYARPVELIIPSIGFGLLYLHFGLLPAIVLHFAFDVVLFALPIFLSDAPGIWIQQLMVVVVTLAPAWVVLWRRVRAGRWTQLSPADRNEAWTPSPVAGGAVSDMVMPAAQLTERARTRWLAAGAVSLLACTAAAVYVWTEGVSSLPITRADAVDRARTALERRGVTFDRRWRFLSMPENGSQGPHEFVSTTAGETRRSELVGRYLPTPRWRVRIVTFEGDVADRAEEWNAHVTPAGEVSTIVHVLPEGRAGARLDETTARELARKAVLDRYGLDEQRGEVREVSNRPTNLKMRTDWTFTLVDATIATLPQGEPRISVTIAGDEVVGTNRFIFVPEHWQRQQRAANTRNLIVRVLGTMVFAGLLVASAVRGVIAWSRRRFSPRLFIAGATLMLVVSVARSANNWPQLLVMLSTASPLELQILGVVGVGLVGLILTSALVGLSLGATPQRLAPSQAIEPRDALRLAMVGGLFAAAASIAAAMLDTPEWASMPDLSAAGAMIPIAQAAIAPLPRLLMASAILLPALIMIDEMTSAWTRRRIIGTLLLLVIGFAGAGVPAGMSVNGWLAAGAVTAPALAVAYVTLLRFDLTMVPLAIGVMMAAGAVLEGAERAYPGALGGSLIAAMLSLLLGWWWSRALRRARTKSGTEVPATGPALQATAEERL